MSAGVGMMPFGRLLLAAVVALSPASIIAAEDSVVVANDEYRVEIVRAERHDALIDGMLRPEDPRHAFLLLFLQTDDPCLDPESLDACFDGVDPDEKLAWACGWVLLGDDEKRLADGGGILDGEIACSYVVPRRSKRLRLALRGYPEIELAPALSAGE